MKKIQLYIIAIFTITLAITGCTKFLEDESMKADTPPVASIEVSGVADSTFTLHISSNNPGYLGYLISSDTAATLTTLNVLSGSLAGSATTVDNQAYEFTANGDLTVEIAGILPNKLYKVFCGATNINGVESEVVTYIVKTNDNFGPSLVSFDPESTSDASIEKSQSISITFDEPILEGSGKFTFDYYFEGVTMDSESISVSGNTVTVYQNHEVHSGDYFFLSWTEGAITDLSGNPVAAMSSGVNADGELEGLYWRSVKVAWDFDVATFAPEAGSAVSDPDFTIEFAAPFAVSNKVADGSIRLVLVGSGVTSVYKVPAANVTVAEDGKSISVVKPFSPTFGESIYIEVAAGSFTDDFSNPNAAIESGMDGINANDDAVTEIGWLVSYGYTIDMILSSYYITNVSTFDGVNYDNANVTVVADDAVENGVIITGLFDSEVPVNGVFDGDFATLTIAQDQSLGDLLGDGSAVLLWSNKSATGDLVGYIQPDGSIIMDWAAYIVGGVNDNSYYDRYYGSVWTKQDSAGIPNIKSKKHTKFYPMN
ncbi:MAG: Ig-like domain-containing protein [Prolixibacteraceae bacterium]